MGKMIDLLPDPRSPAALLIGIPEESTQHHAGLLSVCGAPVKRWPKTHALTHSRAHTKDAHTFIYTQTMERNMLKQTPIFVEITYACRRRK